MPPQDGDAGPDRDHCASLSLTYDDRRVARLVERSVRVETGEIADDRSRATVARDGAAVTVRIEAADPVALRAGLNTWTRLVEVTERVAALG